jgi:hypothetical protein
VLSVPLQEHLDQNLRNKPLLTTDSTDRFNPNTNMLVLSVPIQGYLDQNLENRPLLTTDSTDKFNSNSNLSVLSVPIQGYLDKNLENNPLLTTDSTDKFNSSPNLSVLSVPLQGYFDQNLGDRLLPTTDNTDRFILDDYEERLAIAEYDGQQSPTQAERIAYLDAFVSVLLTLPYDDGAGDWLSHRITAAKEWLLAQNISQPK